MSAIMRDVKDGIARFNANMINITDELVVSSPKRAQELTVAFGSLARSVEYRITLRFDVLSRLSDEALRDLRRTGCRIAVLGLESGSNRVLKLMGKNCTVDDILTGLYRLSKADIMASGAVMVGQDTETREDTQATAVLLREAVRIDSRFQGSVTIVTPFPGSPLYNLLFERRLIADHEEFYRRYFLGPGLWKQVVNVSAMDDDEVMLMHDKLEQELAQARRQHQGWRAVGLSRIRKRVGRFNAFVEEWVMPKIRGRLVFNRLCELWEWVYGVIQRVLENMHVRAIETARRRMQNSPKWR